MTDKAPIRAVIVLGATATGKTRLAVKLAQAFAGEVISVDSRQIYRGLDIGSGKDLEEYGGIPYHLIDVADPTLEFSLFDYLKQVKLSLSEVTQRQHLPVFAGGTGLFLDALIRGYELVEAPRNDRLRAELAGWDQQALVQRLSDLKPLHNTTDTEDRERTIRAIEIAQAERDAGDKAISIQLSPLLIGLRAKSDVLRQRIETRLSARLDAGMIEETQTLIDKGVSWRQLHNFGLEYRFVASYIRGELNRNDLQQKLASAIYQFARQQVKWFRRMERHGVEIHWFDIESLDDAGVIELVRPFAGSQDNN